MTTDNATRSAPVDQTNNAAETGRDLVFLVARIGLAVLMIWHAKIVYEFGGSSLSGVADMYGQQGVPLAAISAPANVLGEFFGGIALILGLAVRLVGALMIVNMIAAWIIVHPNPLYNASLEQSGPEMVIALGLLSLMFVAVGSGRFGLDPYVARAWRRRRSGSTS
jgi:putative oxidoreductase